MNNAMPRRRARKFVCAVLCLILLFEMGAPFHSFAQTPADSGTNNSSQTRTPESGFRLERIEVIGGAQLLTVFGKISGQLHGDGADSDVPLVSILHDTLGDTAPENDRLRYVWMHTYTRPSAGQRAASAVPFLYRRVGSKNRASADDVPPHLIDLAGTERDVWQRLFWNSLQTLLLNSYGFAVRAATQTYRRNADDYRKAHIIRALAVLMLYQAESGTQQAIFAPHELKEIQARLMLTEKTFGGLIDDLYLNRVYEKQTAQWLDTRGHNWELLRQRAEAEGLYFEPLDMRDGATTHALLWIARSDVKANQTRRFDRRFLNLANPWDDARLHGWRGYTETRYFDADNRRVPPGTAGARPVELIPLALYGLDHPKIPILLVDFRDNVNPKRREMSRRVLQDVARTTLGLSSFNLPYFLGRAVYDFVTDRRGMDVNQPARLRAYSQLKLLLTLDASLDPKLRDELAHNLERVSLNPLENDLAAEAKLAREQYAALLDYARRPAGLGAKLTRDRRAELMQQTHSRPLRTLFRLAHIASLGSYKHREQATPEEQKALLDEARSLAHHRRFLREVAHTSAAVEVQWDIAEVRRSLRFIEERGARADGKTASAIARIFAHTADARTRELCLSSLYRINNETAKNSLVRIYRDETADARWRTLSADYLRRAAREEQRISAHDAKVIATIGGQ